MTVRVYKACLYVAFAALCVGGAAHAAPRATKATYNGYMNGMPVGVITETFEAGDGGYRIVSETKPVGLAVFVQRQPLRFQSRGQLSREGLRPQSFEARRNANEPPQVTADFDWGAGELTLKHGGKVESMPLPPGTQDRLSIMYQFMFVTIDKTRPVEFSMTNGRKVDNYRYRVTPDVVIDTPLGRVKTVHLEKIRDVGDTAAEIWLSSAHQQFPMKMVIVEKDGVRYEQTIQSLELK
jgi:hypothetical protein